MEEGFLSGYPAINDIYDEMMSGNVVRNHYRDFVNGFSKFDVSEMDQKNDLAKKLFMTQGITFTVYNDGEGIEKIFPFDVVPRIIQSSEWEFIQKGIKQRLKALNIFLKDVYHQQFIIKDEVLPSSLVYTCPNYLREMINVDVPFDIYTHISGIDLIRDYDGSYYVLEDNLRTPSGVSYMLENRKMSYRLFPNILPNIKVKQVNIYPDLLIKNLLSFGRQISAKPNVVLLTPGIFNSAYFEHTTLARLMGIELVEGRDLVVQNHQVYMKTTKGLKKVDVIYRRVDDEFIDPLVFRQDSVLGVPGLYHAYRKGNVIIVNAMGNGVADDKAIYSYVPDMIRYYLGEEPILKSVPTYRMENMDERKYAIENMHKMVVKKTNESGGYGMLIGDKATDEEIAEFTKQINLNPRSYIAQPIIKLSTAPCYINGVLQPRRVDLRPFALYGPDGIDIVPGGLTRVALKEGSIVVNSSQGGGSKDTWVVD
ncbi:circularly permuted type 2 ATP-grasp protein [Epilithonimonas vandammei]|uniref:Circularly permuted type 2 ATP-grasp protein n=1 Tax=Epilithonimonas vandammei TaxID=2487072 RepID=A0A3G8YAS5_9FLAO|nr:circularly permuted type 2 ATP-grasp protein [Epilithonimonas vandammei]AZI39574.1 circularly permuted type 2 ATP-grasp protein [Epilithonimonas vandammei]AZI56527.1 circularly permuted type 2 ATP-grasp protein [Epilithonimonas vandammei]